MGKKNNVHSLARYRSEAKKEPFVLQVDDNKTITIVQPSGDDLLEVEKATNSRDGLKYLAGDQSDALLKVVGPEDAGVLKAVVRDLRDHFGLAD